MGWLVKWPLIWWEMEVLDLEDAVTQSQMEKEWRYRFLKVKGNIVWNEYKARSLVSDSEHHSVPHKLALLLCVS